MRATSLGPTVLALGLAATAPLALQGCDGGGGDADVPRSGAAAEDDPSGVKAIAGLYDASYEEFGERDVLYVEAAADGTWTEYDYEGDGFDGGGNCYTIADYRVARLEGDRYRIVRADGGERAREAVLVRVGESLRVTFADAGGETSDSVTEIWLVLEGLSATDFEPCGAPG